MGTLNKIDFAAVLAVKNANPNGDPLNGNRPRTNYDGFGEISDVCIKRKLRNRLMSDGHAVLVQSDDNKNDNCTSIKARIEETLGNIARMKKQELYEKSCKTWIDVRSFGHVMAFGGDDKGISVGIRGPVSIHSAFSLQPVSVSSIQITKSVNSEGDSSKKSSDTMGMKHRVDFGVYVLYGSINPQLAEKTGFGTDDAAAVKQALRQLFDDDASSARPEGSMEVYRLYWWQHNCETGQHSSAKVHRSLKITVKEGIAEPKSPEDYDIQVLPLDGLVPEVIEGR